MFIFVSETYLKQSTESQTSSVYENTVSPSGETSHARLLSWALINQYNRVQIMYSK